MFGVECELRAEQSALVPRNGFGVREEVRFVPHGHIQSWSEVDLHRHYRNMIIAALTNMGNLNFVMLFAGANDRCWREPPFVRVATPHFAPSAMRPIGR